MVVLRNKFQQKNQWIDGNLLIVKHFQYVHEKHLQTYRSYQFLNEFLLTDWLITLRLPLPWLPCSFVSPATQISYATLNSFNCFEFW